MAPDTAEIRPPRNGPTLRQTNPDKRLGSRDCALSEGAASVTAQSISRDGARIAESDDEDVPTYRARPESASRKVGTLLFTYPFDADATGSSRDAGRYPRPRAQRRQQHARRHGHRLRHGLGQGSATGPDHHRRRRYVPRSGPAARTLSRSHRRNWLRAP